MAPLLLTTLNPVGWKDMSFRLGGTSGGFSSNLLLKVGSALRSEHAAQSFSWSLKTSKDGDCTTSLAARPTASLSSLWKRFFLMSTLKLSCFPLIPLSLILSWCTTVKSLPLFSLPCRYGKTAVRFPKALFSGGWTNPGHSASSLRAGDSNSFTSWWSYNDLTEVYGCSGVPKLDAVWSNKCWVEGNSHFPQSAGSVPIHTAHVLLVLLLPGLAYAQLTAHPDPQGLTAELLPTSLVLFLRGRTLHISLLKFTRFLLSHSIWKHCK